MVDSVLNNNSWETISEISASGQASNYWSVGDTKKVNINGIVGNSDDYINCTVESCIIGFNHNSNLEGQGIHFSLIGANGVLPSFYASVMSIDGTKLWNMNHWGDSSETSANRTTNYGGWKSCDLRYDILGSTNKPSSNYGSYPRQDTAGYNAPDNTATNPVPNTLMAALPLELRTVLKPITKWTDNIGGTRPNNDSVTSSIDYLPLFSEYEISGNDAKYATYSDCNTYEQEYQSVYAFYINGNSQRRTSIIDKTIFDDVTIAKGHYCDYLLRSPASSTVNSFCEYRSTKTTVQTRIATVRANVGSGLAPIFMV